MPGFGLQLSTMMCVRVLDLPGEIQNQTCMKDSEVVKGNVALACFSMSFWNKCREVLHGQDK